MTLNNALENYVKDKFHSPDMPVYHYTNPTNLDPIMKMGYLKLNPHHLLNKKGNNELKIGVEIILGILQKFRLYNLIIKFKEYINRGVTFYTVSFSQEAKSAWALKNYGSSCIEFNPKFLEQFALYNRSTLFGNVIYKKQLQEKIISEMFDLFEEHKKNVSEPVVDLFMWLNLVIPLLKEKNMRKTSNVVLSEQKSYITANYAHPYVQRSFYLPTMMLKSVKLE